LGGDDPSGAGGDGLAFVIQDDPRGVKALGDPNQGNALGYGGEGAVTHSIALRLGIFGAAGESLGTNGEAQPYGDTVPVDLRSGHPIRVTLTYDGAVLTETFKDQATGDTFTEDHAVDIPAVVGSPTALVGFSGASGDATATQTVSDFVFTERPAVPVGQRKHVNVVTKSYKTLTDYVDPLIGTTAGGNTYPGAVVPFGMVQFSPDTSSPSIGYDYNNRQIQGFSLTHMSGVGCNDYGDVFLTATTGPVKTALADYQSSYSHRDETVTPGYYQVRLTKWNVNTELTATERAGLVRFTFPAGQPGSVLVPISHTLTKTYGAQVSVVGSDEIDGQVTSQNFCGSSGRYTVYFVMKFDRPFQTFGTWAGTAQSDSSRSAAQTADSQPEIGAYVGYPGTGDRSVTARIGISFVDAAGARANLAGEVGTKSFDDVRKQAAKTWENQLHVLDAQGGTTAQRTVFYTALYHCLLMPNVISDADGRYLGYDAQIHQVEKGHAVYANYSGWDIYRNEAPLLALIAPQRMADMCQSIALMYKQGGWIDRWPQDNTYTNVMCGSPLTTFVATAWNDGLRGYDMTSLYDGMYKDATQPAPGGKPYQGEANVQWMDKVGYIPDDKEGYGAVSQTEEDCYAYAALASVAASLGKTDDAALLHKRALNYRNVFDPETKFLRPRKADGTWVTPFDPASDQHYVEGTAWHYRWLATQDMHGLIGLFGGDDAFNTQLDAFFAYPHPEWVGQYYNPYNETDLEAPFLYDYSGAPWKSQAQVRKLIGEVYKTTPDGIPGNDDCGTMSAWLVFAAMGFYPTDPARPAFELVSPLFPKVTLHLSAPYSGKTFTVSAPAASDANQYIQSVQLGRQSLNHPWFTQKDIAQGGQMTVTLGPAPNKTWGAAPNQRPPSLSD
jgi:predicted alpha-1,2-mannosidase